MRAENPSHALALVIVDELARCGVTDAVLAPGSRSAALAMAMHDDPRIRLHVEVDERSAGFLAIGLARATGRPAPVVVTSGTAVANLHPAVIEADAGNVPLLLLTADRPPEQRHTGANQTIDQIQIFGQAPRWFVELGLPEDRPRSVAYWRSSLSRAVAEATGVSASPGPVHVNLAFREPTVPLADDGRSPVEGWSQPLDGRTGGRPWVGVERTPRIAPDADLTDLAARIMGTERGLIVVGTTDARPGPILDLARASGWPLIAEATSGVRSGPDVIARAHHLLSLPAFARAHTPDLVLRIGRTGLSRQVAALLGSQVPQILLDPDGAWHDPERAISDIIVADVGMACASLAAQLAVSAGSEWRDGWQAADAVARDVIDAILDSDDTPTEPRTARDVAAALPDGSTLVVASSMPVRDLDLFMAPRDGLRMIANRGASGIDGFVSTALGVALAAEGPTVALTGDLSLLHDANGFLLSPAAEGIDLTFVVVDNDGGGIFSFLPQAGFPGSFERVFGTPHGRSIRHLAALHNLGYSEVTSASALADAVSLARTSGGVHLVHVRTDRATNVELHTVITAEVCRAIELLA